MQMLIRYNNYLLFKFDAYHNDNDKEYVYSLVEEKIIFKLGNCHLRDYIVCCNRFDDIVNFRDRYYNFTIYVYLKNDRISVREYKYYEAIPFTKKDFPGIIELSNKLWLSSWLHQI